MKFMSVAMMSMMMYMRRMCMRSRAVNSMCS